MGEIVSHEMTSKTMADFPSDKARVQGIFTHDKGKIINISESSFSSMCYIDR